MSRQTQLSQFMNSGNGLSAVTDGRGAVHKERGEEKGKSPHSPLKEKEGQKEISAASVSVFASVFAAVSASVKVSVCVTGAVSVCSAVSGVGIYVSSPFPPQEQVRPRF